jgi:hypothetical protein
MAELKDSTKCIARLMGAPEIPVHCDHGVCLKKYALTEYGGYRNDVYLNEEGKLSLKWFITSIKLGMEALDEKLPCVRTNMELKKKSKKRKREEEVVCLGWDVYPRCYPHRKDVWNLKF